MKNPFNHAAHKQTKRLDPAYKEKQLLHERKRWAEDVGKRQFKKAELSDEQIAANREKLRKKLTAWRLKKKAQKASTETKLVEEKTQMAELDANQIVKP